LTFYQTLLVSPTASAAEIKAAHRKLAIRFHPDKLAAAATTMQSSNNSLTSSASSPHLHVLQGAPLPNDVSSNGNGGSLTHHPLLQPMAFNGVLSASDAQALFISIQEAYECLRNPLERKRYDAALRRGIRYKKLPSVSVDDAVPGWDSNNTRVPTPSSAERTDFSSSSSFSATSWYPFAASTAPGTAASSRTSTRRNSRVNNNAIGASSGASPESSVAPDSASSTTTTDFNNAEWGSSSVGSSARSSRRNSLIKPAARVLLVPVALLSACVFVLVLQPLEFVRAALASRLRVFLPLPTGGKSAAATSPGSLLRRVADVMLVYLCVLLYGPVQALLLFRAIKKLIRRAVRRAVLGSTDEDAATSPYTSAPPPPTSATTSTAGTPKTADTASSVDATPPAAVAADSTSTPTKQQETVFREPMTLRHYSPRPSVQLQPEESLQSEQSTHSAEQPRPMSPLQFSDSDSSPVLASRRVTQLQQQHRDFLKHRGPSSRRMDTASTSPSSSGSASPAGRLSVSASMASLEEAVVAGEATGNDDAGAAAEAGGAD
jgi:curved DNA-binding protein CbpA